MKLTFVGIAAAAALIAGCNTMRGVGEDISAGGKKVEDVLKNDKRDTTGTSSSATTSSTPAESDADWLHTTPDMSDTSMSASPSGTSTQ